MLKKTKKKCSIFNFSQSLNIKVLSKQKGGGQCNLNKKKNIVPCVPVDWDRSMGTEGTIALSPLMILKAKEILVAAQKNNIRRHIANKQ